MNEHEEVVIVGDFHFPNLDWENPDSLSASEELFLETLQDNTLTQVMNKPTRGPNNLDLVIVGNTDSVEQCEVLPPLGESDHCGTKLDLNIYIPRVNLAPRKVYLYSKGDYQLFNKDIKNIDSENLFKNKKVNQRWEILKENYNYLLDKHVPSKYIKSNSRLKPPWISKKEAKNSLDTSQIEWPLY